jgi:hypothetical protein
MKMVTGKSRGSVVGKDVYAGIDVHKESWQVTVRAEGEEIFSGRIPDQYQSLKKLFERYQFCRKPFPQPKFSKTVSVMP